MKKKKGKKLMMILTVVLLLLSAAAFGAKHYLAKLRERQKPDMTVPEAVIVQDNGKGAAASGLTAGANIVQDPTVLVEKGTAFVRFNVELADSDGVPFSEKLEQKSREIEDFKNNLDPESPSYQSFVEAYHLMLNEYNMLYAKGMLAFGSLCRDEDYSYYENTEYASELTPNIPSGRRFSENGLGELAEEGKITFLTDEDPEMSGDTDFVQIYDEENPFSRQYLYKNKVAAGESCSLFTNIIIPSDWDISETEMTVYRKNDDNSFSELTQGVNNMQILGEGFSVTISAEIVTAADFDDPISAFEAAEDVSAVTEISSSYNDGDHSENS